MHRVGETDALQGPAGTSASFPAWESGEPEKEVDEGEARHLAVERVLLGTEARIGEVGAIRERIASEDFDRPSGWPNLSGHELEEGGLSRSIRSEEAENPAFERQ
jgi:hypothetical protein